MSLSDCPKCWETPYVCGYEYQNMSQTAKDRLLRAITSTTTKEDTIVYVITLQATFPSPFIAEMKRVLHDNKCSWRQMHCSGLDMWQSMAFTRFANNVDSYYVGSGMDEKDYFTIQGNELTLRSTVPHNKMLIVDLKSMLESVASCSQIEVEETNNV